MPYMTASKSSHPVTEPAAQTEPSNLSTSTCHALCCLKQRLCRALPPQRPVHRHGAEVCVLLHRLWQLSQHRLQL